MAGPSRAAPRTFTESLRGASRPELATLLSARPDLADPVPLDVVELVNRATSTGSVARAVDGLDAWQRQVLLALAVLADPVSLTEVSDLLGAQTTTVADAVTHLRSVALVWGEDDGLHLIRAAREQFGSYPAGLAPLSPVPLADDEIDQLLTELGPADAEVLDRLLWSPAGSVPGADRTVTRATAQSPVERLLARRLLRAVDKDHVLLPREVAWRRRTGRLTPDLVSPTAPVVLARPGRVRLIDNGAAGAALDLLHDLELVVRAVEAGQIHLLRAGGVGQRDLSVLEQQLGTGTDHTAFLLEAATAAGLIAVDGPVLAVTTTYDRWRAEDAATRWHEIVRAWLAAPRRWSPSAGGHPIGPDGDLVRLADLRPLLIDLLLAAGPGHEIDLDTLERAVAWRRPGLRRIGPLPLAEALALAWLELGHLGAVALGAVSRLAVAIPQPNMPTDLAGLFPEPVEQVVIQGDLTAVAPGPLVHHLATELRLLADQESRGAGSVYRFTASSLRRALDAGWSGTEIRSWLTRHSTTGVPQPLSYLVDDVARRHGDVRVGLASSYLSVGDESELAALLAHPKAAGLGLRQVGPGVVVASADPEELIEWLRAIGHSPTAEDAYGRQLRNPGPYRIRTAQRVVAAGPSPDDVAAAVLAGSAPGPDRSPRSSGEGQSTAEALLLLARATQQARRIQVAYVGTDGTPVERALSPLDLDGGQLRAVDVDHAQVVTIPLSRISNIRETDDQPVD